MESVRGEGGRRGTNEGEKWKERKRGERGKWEQEGGRRGRKKGDEWKKRSRMKSKWKKGK